MRRKDREMNRDFALYVADKCEYATMAMTDEKGLPYCVPVTIVRKGEYIYFHSAKEGRKIDILRENPSVCISCVGDTYRTPDRFTTEFESAIIFGEAYEVTEDGEKTEALRLLCLRHTPSNMDAFDSSIEKSLFRTGVWKVKIREITGKRKKYDKAGKEMKYGRME
ncbi:MAG TPA: pyridoxamine 5'-phosphate oxidase family protein [Candidatus Copromorpha excrementigallinarum]|uniref:Pyridoxamine 5'-phosphate oxidase family protein n=1 Tax=Candidatus Allocopromorpha excrementigallinarum TaxID=2840742 RepID=A0A9D1HYM9_9FIRM|nr:pyridoxamine 5'-phosphate oxidase family protein [Candidatus Copromorpha excrementigallinarum]